MKSILTKTLILILLFTMINISNSVYATDMDNVIQEGEGFLASRYNTSPINETALEGTSDYVYNILFTIAVVLAVAIGMIIGIQFITGSVEEQAKVKETLVPYVIGVFIVFASFTIWKIVVEIGDDVSPTPEATGNTSSTGTGSYTSVTYTKDADGKLYCDGCGDELSTGEQRRGQCGGCKSYIKGI